MTETLRIAAIHKIEEHQKAIEALAGMLRSVPDEMLDREMDGVYIGTADVWDDGRPYISCSLRPKPEDKALGTALFNAQAFSWDLQTHVRKTRRAEAGQMVESFRLRSVFGCLYPHVRRPLGQAPCRKAIVTKQEEITVCGELDESQYVDVQYVD